MTAIAPVIHARLYSRITDIPLWEGRQCRYRPTTPSSARMVDVRKKERADIQRAAITPRRGERIQRAQALVEVLVTSEPIAPMEVQNP